MTIRFLFPPILLALLSGCATQSADVATEQAGDLPAPVRESSIVAPEEVIPASAVVESIDSEHVEMEVDAALSEVSSVGEAASDQADLEEVAEVSQPDTPAIVRTVVPRQVAPKEVNTTPEAAEELTQTVTEILPEVANVPAEKTVLDEESGESEVLAYLLNEAQNSFEKENYEKARGQSERALTLEPNAARAYLILARIELLNGNNDVAAELARKGISGSEHSGPVFEQLNEVLGQLADQSASSSTPLAPASAGQIQ